MVLQTKSYFKYTEELFDRFPLPEESVWVWHPVQPDWGPGEAELYQHADAPLLYGNSGDPGGVKEQGGLVPIEKNGNANLAGKKGECDKKVG